MLDRKYHKNIITVFWQARKADITTWGSIRWWTLCYVLL